MSASLPYADGTFDIVVTRFSMHHFLDPLSVLREMVRVCAPGGRIVVIDMYASDDPAKAAEWNRREAARSVACAVPDAAGAKALFRSGGAADPRHASMNCATRSGTCWHALSPSPGDDAKIIEMFAASAEDDRLGIPVRREGERIGSAYPIAILAADRLSTEPL